MAESTKEIAAPAAAGEKKDEVRVVAIACGSSHTLILLNCDILCSCGRGEDGQLGIGDPQNRLRPTVINALHGMFGVMVYD